MVTTCRFQRANTAGRRIVRDGFSTGIALALTIRSVVFSMRYDGYVIGKPSVKDFSNQGVVILF
jgi:hypothetical protein